MKGPRYLTIDADAYATHVECQIRDRAENIQLRAAAQLAIEAIETCGWRSENTDSIHKSNPQRYMEDELQEALAALRTALKITGGQRTSPVAVLEAVPDANGPAGRAKGEAAAGGQPGSGESPRPGAETV